MKTPTNDLVTATEVSKKFGDHTVLQDISFTVPNGTVTVVLGPSGSGKTTLLRGLNALELFDSGQVQIGDASVDFNAIRANRRGRLPGPSQRLIQRYRAQSGMVFQGHNLFPHRTALENVMEGPVIVQHRPVAEARAEALSLL